MESRLWAGISICFVLCKRVKGLGWKTRTVSTKTLGLPTVCSSASAGTERSITMVTNDPFTDDLAIAVSAKLVRQVSKG